jgi:hypothetical protein
MLPNRAHVSESPSQLDHINVSEPSGSFPRGNVLPAFRTAVENADKAVHNFHPNVISLDSMFLLSQNIPYAGPLFVGVSTVA